ncbi:unnamed protein product [Linum tenue]|uniref:Uncharacterized protein n=1 Tax=Linum tenue TaxID=586396 RepID=A0AAV0I2U9_9ROSI|nr:unnamed protein product [Linum tenue]
MVCGQGSVHGDEVDNIPNLLTEELQKYVRELDWKTATLTRAIQDLRQRLPPADISQRLPHLLAHSLASNAALKLQLNAHSATKEQVKLRTVSCILRSTSDQGFILGIELKELKSILWSYC